MHSKTYTLSTSAKREEVFTFLARPENLPRWATGFCKSVHHEEGHWTVETDRGPLRLAIDAEENTGVVDMYAGPGPEQMEVFPIRVLTVGDQTLATFTFVQSPGCPDDVFQSQCESLERELGDLAGLVGGGTVGVP